MGALSRAEFLNLTWAEQKLTDLRKVFDPETSTDLTVNCIMTLHRDDSASMVIYANGVWCFGCKTRLWPDQFVKMLGDLPLETERGAPKQPAPKFIPMSLVKTYQAWLATSYYTLQQKWLLNRGLTLETLERNMIGHTGEAYTIPIFDGGIVRSIRYRRDDELAGEDRPKYWGTPGANDAMLYQPGRGNVVGYDNSKYGLILCEGELDALRLAQVGYPAVSLTNGCHALKAEHVPALQATAALMRNRITLCYDQDEEGHKGADAAFHLLIGRGEDVARLRWSRQQGKDVTEYIKNTSPAVFERLLKSAWA